MSHSVFDYAVNTLQVVQSASLTLINGVVQFEDSSPAGSWGNCQAPNQMPPRGGSAPNRKPPRPSH
jgi:hypothetical protein